ncbi:MAG: hypothetical protein ACYSUV_10300 [Planctomycetota bacterium]|jgi:hypothetical protein
MSDLKLSDGREVTIDLYKVTIKEWRDLLNPEQAEEDEYATLAKVCGMKPEEVAGLAYPDFRLLGQKVAEKASNPLSDPNS